MNQPRPLKILQVANGYPPGAMGGVETYTRALCRALDASGHSVSVFCREEVKGRRELSWRDETIDGLPVRRVVNNFVHVSGFADYYYNPDIEALFSQTLSEWQPDIVHFQHAIGLSASLPERAAEMGVPTVWTLWDYWPICPVNTLLLRSGALCPGAHHPVNCFECVYGAPQPFPGRHIPRLSDDDPEPEARHPFGMTEGTIHTMRRVIPRSARLRMLDAYNLFSAARTRLRASRAADSDAGPSDADPPLPPPAVAFRTDYMRSTLGSCDALVAPLPFVRDTYVEFGISPPGIRVIEPGMDLTGWDRAPRPSRPTGAPLRLAYIGSLMRHKGVDLLVEAMRGVSDADVELQMHGFTVKGDPYGGELTKAAQRDRRIRLMGPYEQHDLPQLLADADVLLMPARWHETFSFVTREGVLAGLPVLAANMGGMRAAIDEGVNGHLLPPHDVGAWSAAIQRLADDPSIVARMTAAQARHPVRSIEDNAAELAALYQALATNGGRPQGAEASA